jgi:hypothetical protein
VKASAPTLVRVARLLARILEPGPSAVAGALAVAVHGYVRATKDVDLVTGIPLAEARRRLVEHGVKAALKRGDALEGDFSCVKGVLDGVEFAVLPLLVPIEWENAVELPLAGGEKLKVVDLRTLIHLKLRAGGPQDVLDVVMLLQRHPEHLPVARELATGYLLTERLESFMNDPRIRAKAPRGRRRRPTSARRPRRRKPNT